MKIAIASNNFSRGKADHDLNGRFDLPIYGSGADVFKNFFSNFKGNAIFRPGFEVSEKWQDCALMEFKFNNAQSYIVAMINTKMRFLSYDVNNQLGWVLSAPSTILEVTTPYTLAHSKEIALKNNPQNADVMYIFHSSYAPRKLVRASATSFTLATYTRTADPFDDPSTGTVGWPDCGAFYKGFLYCAAPSKKTTSLYRSKAASYDDYTTGTDDDDGFNFAVSDLTEPIRWIAAGNNSLIAGSSQAIVAINGGSTDAAITPTTVEATITNTDGASANAPIRKDQLLFYIDNLQRRIMYFSYDLLTESFKAEDANFISYDITIGKAKKLVYIKDKNDLIWVLTNDGKVLSLNFNQNEKIVGWHEHSTGGTVIDITRMSDNAGNLNLFATISRTNGVFIERLTREVEFPLPHDTFTGVEADDREAYWRLISEKLKACIYLDNSVVHSNLYTSTITYTPSTGRIVSNANDFSSGDVGNRVIYKTVTGEEIGYFEIVSYVSATTVVVEDLTEDGPHANTYASWYKSFSSVSGLTDWASKEVSVVADGGYIGEYTISAGGVLTLDKEVTVVVIGDIYEGLIKTFNLGFQAQGINTQITPKSLIRAGLRFVFSAGGLIGTSLYNMVDVQEYDPSGFYDLPPLPMDGDKSVDYTDDLQKERCLYIKQDKPLPFHVTAVFSEMDYGTKT